MTLGTLTLQNPNSLSVDYSFNGYEHETMDGNLTRFVKNFHKVYTLEFDGIVSVQRGYIDTFNSSALDTRIWEYWGETKDGITIVSSELNLSSQLEAKYLGVNTVEEFDMTGMSITVKVTDSGNQSIESYEAYPITLVDNPILQQNYVEFNIIGGNLAAYKKVSGSSTNLKSVAYNATNHKYLRIRESSGTTYWDTSADGITWTNFHSVANPITMTSLFVRCSVGTWQTEASVTTMKIDEIRIDEGVDLDYSFIREEVAKGELDFVLSDYGISTKVLANISEEDIPYGGSEYRRVVTLTLIDQTTYNIGGTLPTTGLSSGIRINEVYHPEPHDIKILNDIGNVDMLGQDGISTRDYMHNRLRMKIDWKNILNADLKKIVDNVLYAIYPNVTHDLFDETAIIEIIKEEYRSTGVGDLSLIITSISGTFITE